MLDVTKPMARADDGENCDMWHYIHDHEKRMQLLERDSHDIKKSMQDMAMSLALVNKGVENLEHGFDSRLSAQLLLHENRESNNQRRTMLWTIGVLLAVLGGFSTWLLNKVAIVGVPPP